MSNYNQARYLDESLGGLIGQTLPAEKIIVIDDGSTDGSVDIIRRYEARSPQLRLIRNAENIGLQDSIARALPLIDTEYLAWAASDDKLLPDFLERSMALLDEHPDVGLCFSELTVLKDDTGEIQRFAEEPSVSHIFGLSDLPRHMPPEAVAARMKRSYFPVSGNTVVVRRDKLAACGNFFKELEWHSDHFAFNVVALRYGACVVSDTLGLMRQRSESYSASGLGSPDQLRPVLESMLSIIAREDFRDVREAFARAPSYYSVWGNAILRLMLRRPAFWRTVATFTAWKFKQYRLGYNLTRAQAIRRLGARALRAAIPRGPSIMLFGKKKRAFEAQIASLSEERDGLIAERDRLAQAVHETAMQRDAANSENARLNMSIAELDTTLSATRQTLKNVQDDVAKLRKEMREKNREVTNLKRTARAQDAAIEKLTTDHAATVEQLTAEHGTAIGNLTEERDALVEERRALQSHIDVLEVHDGPEPAGFFTPDAVIYEEAEPRPDAMVIMTTMPKSGTYYISRLIGEGLGLRPLIVSNQYFPEDTIYQPRLREFVKGGYITQDHFPASAINIAHLSNLTDRVIVQLRDPRQAMLSYVHYLGSERFTANPAETSKFVFPPLPDDFYSRDFSGRLEWGLDVWLPVLVEWVQQWRDVADAGTLRVKFTNFEDLVADETAFVEEILDFLEIPRTAFTAPEVRLDARVHFRKGETDEWRGTLSDEQSARATEHLPPELMQSCGWRV